jgi:hypothetical protein
MLITGDWKRWQATVTEDDGQYRRWRWMRAGVRCPCPPFTAPHRGRTTRRGRRGGPGGPGGHLPSRRTVHGGSRRTMTMAVVRASRRRPRATPRVRVLRVCPLGRRRSTCEAPHDSQPSAPAPSEPPSDSPPRANVSKIRCLTSFRFLTSFWLRESLIFCSTCAGTGSLCRVATHASPTALSGFCVGSTTPALSRTTGRQNQPTRGATTTRVKTGTSPTRQSTCWGRFV